jgi:hypothetical protein
MTMFDLDALAKIDAGLAALAAAKTNAAGAAK